MKTAKVKNRDVFIYASKSLLIFFVEQDVRFTVCRQTIEHSNYCATRSFLIARSANWKDRRRNSTCTAKNKQPNFRYSFKNMILPFL